MRDFVGPEPRQPFGDLDPLDVRLIQELEWNPRQTQARLASAVNLSRPTVRARIAKLRRENDLRISCIVDPMVLGYTITVIMGINAQPAQVPTLGKKLAALKPINYLVSTMGRFELTAWASLPNRSDYLDLMANSIGSIDGITHVETMLMLRQEKFIGPLLSDRGYPRLVRDRTITPGSLESALISELQMDATQNTRTLAKKLGTSHSTLMRRIRSLEADGVIRIIAVVNPVSIGYQMLASIYMRVEAAKINEAAGVLASYREVQTVSICAGQYDIVAWTMFRRLDDLTNFITVELGKIPGLQHFDTVTHLRNIKVTNQYLRQDT